MLGPGKDPDLDQELDNKMQGFRDELQACGQGMGAWDMVGTGRGLG